VTAQVLYLPVKKKKRSDAPLWLCMRCDSDVFTLHADGSVFCCNCNSLMRNLSVKKEEDSDPRSA
jgi:hypothetical protein